MQISTSRLIRSLSAACLCGALAQPALAVDVGGVKLDETVQLANRELKLNGAGVRYKVIFKVYTIALYLPEKKTQLTDILALPGPRRLEIVMLRDITSDELGQAFMQGLNRSSDQADRTRLLSQTMQFGAMFEMVPGLKKGDILTVDWLPDEGTLCRLNGKQIGDRVPELAFYNALLKIWIGAHPADTQLRAHLLGDVA
ncbi:MULTISPECIES: chalcone isomerase family protein [unclassified Janthinobacterium]|uniref:chalcone isomerase family protein n=1 Tax=unclassified Janthinobacterium TaxID=2610881 RepID=UPI0008829ACD|nr:MULTISPECIES: chalcone isomerase family protein [unclassified Janthinobacterium]SDA68835.1 Chalcone isomerase-like [Janthinobacterium sp. 551a]SFB51742.1 Chalcone isomerase-like [Janthinobacterium sp. 344]